MLYLFYTLLKLVIYTVQIVYLSMLSMSSFNLIFGLTLESPMMAGDLMWTSLTEVLITTALGLWLWLQYSHT